MSISRMGAETPKTFARANNAGKSMSNAAPSTPNARGFDHSLRSAESLGKSKMPPVVTVR